VFGARAASVSSIWREQSIVLDGLAWRNDTLWRRRLARL
jgi:hypothetical protein